MEGLLTSLITLLVVALIIAFICWIVAKLVSQFLAGAAPYVWVIWAIGGLVLLIYALRLFGPALGLKL